MPDKPYQSIVSHYEACLDRHGDTHLGVDWPKQDDAQTRYRVMLDVIQPPAEGQTVSLLDFGCGAAHLNEYLLEHGLHHIDYAGLDLSEKFVSLSRQKFPERSFYCVDLLDENAEIPAFDYIVLNGVFTEKREVSFEDMLAYFKRLVGRVFARARIGVAFNVMSAHVDWQRDDLFHLPFDTAATFLRQDVTPHFVFRNDYGLYEYTTYLYRSAR